ncbi:phage minor structural protein [Staphylococcus aureus]|nr:phage minor structural protein [Staphylococcus aureus]
MAQALNIGPQGIRLNADKIDISGNREINLLIQNMRDKVDKTDIVNSLNLSREGLDINVNRIGIKGGDNNRYVQIQNDSIELGGIVQRNLERETFNRRYFYATERRSPKI